MSCGAYCKHCRHYAAHHDDAGVCRIKEMGHGGREMKESCACPGYELEPGTDFDPFVDKVCDRIDDARRQGLLT